MPIRRVITTLAVATVAGSAAADVHHVKAFDRGAFDDLGFHDPFDRTYVAGNGLFGDATEARNWFVFDLSNVQGEIESLTLSINAGSYQSGDAFETWTLRAFDMDPNFLTGGVGGGKIFQDLGSGDVLGSYDFDASTAWSRVEIEMNDHATNVAEGALGGVWAFGGAVSTLDDDPFSEELLFGGTDPYGVTLTIVTAVPAPAGFALLGLGLITPGRRRRA